MGRQEQAGLPTGGAMRPPPTTGQWVELRCTLPLIWADPVAEWLLDDRTSGVLIEEGDGEAVGPTQRVALITALPHEADVELLVEQLHALGQNLAACSGLEEALTVETRLIAPAHLEALLAPSFQPVELTSGLWVIPANDDEAAEGIPSGAETIRLAPGLAFGTGRHPSTRLAARVAASWFSRWSHPTGPRVLELGTGSGLLAIVAARWGAAVVFGVEQDPIALANAQRNVALNDLGSRIAFVAADLTTMEPRPWADLLLANLDRDHFLLGSKRLAGWLRPQGAMVASGVLAAHEGPLLWALEEAGLAVVERADESVWVAVLAERR
ncbi:MAG: 50S ribosomal protein L11 methyltransferase [Candidatus Tectimicrobiota bacterium]